MLAISVNGTFGNTSLGSEHACNIHDFRRPKVLAISVNGTFGNTSVESENYCKLHVCRRPKVLANLWQHPPLRAKTFENAIKINDFRSQASAESLMEAVSGSTPRECQNACKSY